MALKLKDLAVSLYFSKNLPCRCQMTFQLWRIFWNWHCALIFTWAESGWKRYSQYWSIRYQINNIIKIDDGNLACTYGGSTGNIWEVCKFFTTPSICAKCVRETCVCVRVCVFMIEVICGRAPNLFRCPVCVCIVSNSVVMLWWFRPGLQRTTSVPVFFCLDWFDVQKFQLTSF